MITFTYKELELAFTSGQLNPDANFSDWAKTLRKEEPIASIYRITNVWQQFDHLTPLKKVDRKFRLIISKAIRKYGITECITMIERYAEILASDFPITFKWNIGDFFQKENAGVNFLDNGKYWNEYINSNL